MSAIRAAVCLLTTPLLLGLLWPAAARAETWPEPVMKYLQTLAAVDSSPARSSLEPMFSAALALQDSAMTIQDDQAWLETLPDEEFASLEQLLRGIRLSRGYDVYAAPDPEFFQQLSLDKGLDPDRAFFRRYRQSWGDDLLPTYLRQTSRVAPCVRYSEGVIPDLYLAWTDFRVAFPQAYVEHATQFVKDLEETVTLGTCACGDQNSVEHELSGFLTLFPQTPATPGIVARLQQLEDDPERQPIHCR